MVVEALYHVGILDILKEELDDEYMDHHARNRGFAFRAGVEVGR